jgi:hypothetical protein
MSDEENDDSSPKIVEVNERDIEARIRDFSELLKNIESVSDKKRQLWREVYENAISDRQNAYVMFVKMVEITGKKSTEHAVHGKTIASYIERMSRANDQLIKLAELIAKAEEKSSEIDPEDMFNRINKR